MKEKAAKTAGDLYEKGKDQVAEVYDTVTKAGSKVYSTAKDELNEAGFSTSRH